MSDFVSYNQLNELPHTSVSADSDRGVNSAYVSQKSISLLISLHPSLTKEGGLAG